LGEPLDGMPLALSFSIGKLILEIGYKYIYYRGVGVVKKRNLEKRLSQYGWRFLRQGGSHEGWTNGEHIIWIPRHKEVNEFTARGLLRKARTNAPRKK
jgi:mRNA interferase HicA